MSASRRRAGLARPAVWAGAAAVVLIGTAPALAAATDEVPAPVTSVTATVGSELSSAADLPSDSSPTSAEPSTGTTPSTDTATATPSGSPTVATPTPDPVQSSSGDAGSYVPPVAFPTTAASTAAGGTGTTGTTTGGGLAAQPVTLGHGGSVVALPGFGTAAVAPQKAMTKGATGTTPAGDTVVLTQDLPADLSAAELAPLFADTTSLATLLPQVAAGVVTLPQVASAPGAVTTPLTTSLFGLASSQEAAADPATLRLVAGALPPEAGNDHALDLAAALAALAVVTVAGGVARVWLSRD